MNKSIYGTCHDSGHRSEGNICFMNEKDQSHFVNHTDSSTELICVLSGNASVLVGSHVQRCRAGDIFLIGADLLHSIQIEGEREIELAILHINEDFLDDTVHILNDFQYLGDLFRQRCRGLFWSDQSETFVNAVLNLKTTKGLDSLTGLIEVLWGLASQKNYDTLNQTRSASVFMQARVDEKIVRVFDYTQEHYREAITLQQIASQVNFTVTSFCRYFKKMTGKNYYNYLNEVRIDNACIILMENRSKSIEEVCYIVGYSSPSTFYKHFKKIVNMTPTAYQDTAIGACISAA